MGNYSEYKELFQRVRQMGAIDDHSICVVGVMFTCGTTFPALADLGLPGNRARRLLLALLDARIMLGALKSALAARRLRYPDDIGRIRIDISADDRLPGLTTSCDGSVARAWAEDLEREICNAIDSLTTAEDKGPPGHDSLLMLPLLDRDAVQVDSGAPGSRWLLLLDDVQKLTGQQRTIVRETLVEQRTRTTVWVAERLEALSRDELLASGALNGRDYADVINLEEAWRRTPKRFEAAIATIAERRARVAADVAAGDAPNSFAAIIDSNLDTADHADKTLAALHKVSDRVRAVASKDARYVDWVRAREDAEGNPRERLIGWRTLEIIVERHRRKDQQSLAIELGRDELQEKDDSGVKAAAELFLAREFSFPYYYGPSRLAALASFNVEQYLSLAGDLFEESLARALIQGRRGAPPIIAPERQQQILSAAYNARIRDLPRRAMNGRDVLAFLDSVGTFCREVTYQPNAPYAPGVNGVAISMREREKLLDHEVLKGNPSYARFAQLLATALANNLLHAEVDKSVKNQRWAIFYLNRLICLRFALPPHFGGFRERALSELIGWMEHGYRVSQPARLPYVD
jgi:hypothetical protein